MQRSLVSMIVVSGLTLALLAVGAPARAEQFILASTGIKGASGDDDHPRLKVVPGRSALSGPGPRKRFIVEIHKSIKRTGTNFAEEVERILFDDRSWGGRGRIGFRRVDSGPADFRVTLAKPAMVDRLCAPLATRGRYSCFNGYRAVINQMRWRRAAASYDFKARLRHYRRYLINHEVGHALGHGHRYCPRSGAPAPVMMQQTKGIWPCRRNWWPLGYERGPRPD